MKRVVPLVLASVLLLAAEPTEQLDAASQMHRDAVGAMAEERTREHLRVKQRYVLELEVAEEKATADGDVELVKLLQAERQRVEAGAVVPHAPADLPRRLQAIRKAYVRDFERLEETLRKRRGAVDSDYLTLLAKLEKEHAAAPALREKIAAEKERVLAGTWGPIADLRVALDGTQWRDTQHPDLIRTFRNGKMNGTWTIETPDRETVVIHWNADSRLIMKLQKDGRSLVGPGRHWTLVQAPED
jgi:hypothetical protein